MQKATTRFANLFINDSYCPVKELNAALFFLVFIVVGLGIDSVYFKESFFDGRWLMNVFAIVHFTIFFQRANDQLRKLMFVMVFLGYLGELVFCEVFEMYHYRTGEIPLYVPFGHALLYATGWVCSQSSWIQTNNHLLKKIFIPFYLLLFAGIGFFLSDTLSVILGTLFFITVFWRKWAIFFFVISLWVILLELVGTYYQCWTWYPQSFGLIHTINPPMGAIFIYAGGDITLNKLVSVWDTQRQSSAKKASLTYS